MRRLALIALAPALAAALLVATGVYRPGSDGTPAEPGESNAPSVEVGTQALPAGTLVLGGRARERAIGLAVSRSGSARLALEASVLGPDGTGTVGLDLVFASGASSVAARPCGPARYCGTLAAALPGEVRVEIAGQPASTTRFDLPATWTPAGDLLARATTVFEDQRSVAYEERLSSSLGPALVSHWQVAAPDRLSYRIDGGASAVVIGNRRWDREPGGEWIESPQDRLQLPAPPWTDEVTNASLLGTTMLDGRRASVVSFLDRASLPTWFTVWIDEETSRTLRLRMTTAAHFMTQRYDSFGERLRIEPPD